MQVAYFGEREHEKCVSSLLRFDSRKNPNVGRTDVAFGLKTQLTFILNQVIFKVRSNKECGDILHASEKGNSRRLDVRINT